MYNYPLAVHCRRKFIRRCIEKIHGGAAVRCESRMESSMKVLVFGEVLWDIFPTQKEIGGAPFNFSAHMAKLGAEVFLVSAVGKDALGEETLAAAAAAGLHTDYIAKTEASTSVCNVSVDQRGIPSYMLPPDISFDFISADKACADLKHCTYDAFYMGTLAQRSPVSRASLAALLKNTSKFKEIFCDINIRQHFYSRELVAQCLRQATILKISKEEYGVFARLGMLPDASAPTEEQSFESDYTVRLCAHLSRTYEIKLIIVTLNKDGAMLYQRDGTILYSDRPTSAVRSTVGAGDSFSACFLYNYLNGAALSDCLNRAVILSDYVVTQLGAVPAYPQKLLEQIGGRC